jgi:hypothetical protein
MEGSAANDSLFLLAALGGAALTCGLLALLIAYLRPAWSVRRTGVIATAIPAALVLLLAVAGIASIGPPGPDEIDAGGMAMAAFMILGTMIEMLLLFPGLPTALLVAHIVRKAQARAKR